MKTFLTEHKIHKHIDTPRVYANSWDEAEKNCPMNCIIIGVLIEEGEIEIIDEINLN